MFIHARPTILEVLNSEQLAKLTAFDPKVKLDTPILAVTYKELRQIASIIFADGNFVYPSDVAKLIVQIEDRKL